MSSSPAELFRIDDATWARITPEVLLQRSMMVVGAFGLAAWNRFGSQGIFEPRASVRMILIGVYGWIGLSLATWLAGAISKSRSNNQPSSNSSDPGTGKERTDYFDQLKQTLVLTTMSHLPMIALGAYIATIGSFLRTTIPGTIIMAIAFALWMPLLLARAVQSLVNIKLVSAVAIMLIPYGLWLGTVGRYLYDQVGHNL